jgi:hypothetical protein
VTEKRGREGESEAVRAVRGSKRSESRRIIVHESSSGTITHVRLDILVLEVEGVLPDIDADDGDVGWAWCQRALSYFRVFHLSGRTRSVLLVGRLID